MRSALDELLAETRRWPPTAAQLRELIDPLDCEHFDTPVGFHLIAARAQLRQAVADIECERVEHARRALTKALASLDGVGRAQVLEQQCAQLRAAKLATKIRERAA